MEKSPMTSAIVNDDNVGKCNQNLAAKFQLPFAQRGSAQDPAVHRSTRSSLNTQLWAMMTVEPYGSSTGTFVQNWITQWNSIPGVMCSSLWLLAKHCTVWSSSLCRKNPDAIVFSPFCSRRQFLLFLMSVLVNFFATLLLRPWTMPSALATQSFWALLPWIRHTSQYKTALRLRQKQPERSKCSRNATPSHSRRKQEWTRRSHTGAGKKNHAWIEVSRHICFLLLHIKHLRIQKNRQELHESGYHNACNLFLEQWISPDLTYRALSLTH